MINRILTLIRNWRQAKTALSTVSLVCDEQNNALDALGGLTEEEMQGLISWLPEEGLFVEVGTLFGLTARAIAAARPKLKIVAVDNFCWNPFGLPAQVHEAFTRRILAQEIAAGQVQLLNMDSAQFRAAITNQKLALPDVIFFDADHRYEAVKEEIEWAKSVGIKTICGHDYGNPNPRFGVMRAVDETFGKEAVETKGMCWKVIL